uniref:Uncharacterized protein n=1 Tax=Phlebotomus papatasi TaxID=29031 RepID=A0A1B0D2Z5_PHLPP
MYDLLIKDLSDGKPEYNIPPLDPVYIKKFNIRTNFLGPFNVHVVYENAKFSGVKNTTTKKFTKMEKDGEIYAQAEKMQMSAKFDRLKLEFDSSRSENKLLEEVAAEYVNANWKESFNAAKESIYESFGEIWTKIYNQITSKIPYRDFFVEESA